MNNYNKFLRFEAVVNVKTEEEYKRLMNRCAQLKLEGASRFLNRISFHDLHTNYGVQLHEYGEMCIEYQPVNGFTMGEKKCYEAYSVEIISVDDFMAATD